MVRTLRQRALVVGAAVALAAGCASRTPAPVVDRLPPPKPAAAPAAPAAGPQYYTVKRGDTLYSIALDHGLDWRELAGMNAITDPTRLRLGQQLVVKPAAPAPAAEGPVVVSPIAPSAPVAARPLGPEAPAAPSAAPAAIGALKTEPKGLRLPYSDENLAVVQRGDAARTAAVPPAAPAPSPPSAAKPEAPPPKPEVVPPVARAAPDPGAAQIDWSWPAAGKVTGGFNGSSNKGIDIGGKVGDPVLASAAGVVQYVGEGIPSLGKLVIVKHGDTYLSAYAHNSEILVKESQKVAKWQQIAKMGATGTDQPKLHFEIRRQGAPLDPLQYLPQR